MAIHGKATHAGLCRAFVREIDGSHNNYQETNFLTRLHHNFEKKLPMDNIEIVTDTDDSHGKFAVNQLL